MVEKHIFTVFALSDSVNDDAFFPSGMGELNDKRVRCQEGGLNDISINRVRISPPPTPLTMVEWKT
jgi:hypothetical protein